MMEQLRTVDQKIIHLFPSHCSVKHVLQSIGATDREDAFYIVNLERLVFLYNHWCDLLPFVKPFYAVKCNTDPLLLQLFAALGGGFDCASKNEIATILDLGVDPSRIIYAHTCKQISHIEYANKVGVSLMTFDNEAELHKIKEYYPTAELVLRIIADDPDAIVCLGVKFGAELEEVPHLLSLAKELDLNVVGISFHIGSRAKSPDAYVKAITLAKESFVTAEKLGFSLKLLDIGGGYPGASDADCLFSEMASAIKSSVTSLFADYHDLRVIAEPGRYFACSTHALAVNIIAKRCVTNDSSKVCNYYINDGVYGSFKHEGERLFTPKLLKYTEDATTTYTSIIWGPTCEPWDRINDTFQLPELDIGDWLYYEDVGDYTVANCTSFSGFSRPLSYYWCTDKGSDTLKKLLGPLTAGKNETQLNC